MVRYKTPCIKRAARVVYSPLQSGEEDNAESSTPSVEIIADPAEVQSRRSSLPTEVPINPQSQQSVPTSSIPRAVQTRKSTRGKEKLQDEEVPVKQPAKRPASTSAPVGTRKSKRGAAQGQAKGDAAPHSPKKHKKARDSNTAKSKTEAAKQSTGPSSSKAKKPSMPIDQIEKFSSPEARDRFEALKKKTLLNEKGFRWSATDPVMDIISRPIAHHVWSGFCAPQEPPTIALVREFYANLEEKGAGGHPFAQVRGVIVSLTVQAVHEVYNLVSPSTDEFLSLLSNPNAALDTLVLDACGIDGATWDVSNTGARSISAHLLTPAARIWIYFIKNRLLPTTHDTTVLFDRVLLAYCIMNRRRINVGRILVEEIVSCAKKKTGKLFFPSLITQLCVKAGVPVASSEEQLLENGIINFQYLLRKYSSPGNAPDQPAAATLSSLQGQMNALQRSSDKLSNQIREIQERLSLHFDHFARNSSIPAPERLSQPWQTFSPDDSTSSE